MLRAAAEIIRRQDWHVCKGSFPSQNRLSLLPNYTAILALDGYQAQYEKSTSIVIGRCDASFHWRHGRDLDKLCHGLFLFESFRDVLVRSGTPCKDGTGALAVSEATILCLSLDHATNPPSLPHRCL
eukprot:4553378-Amphidinium_carterae.1